MKYISLNETWRLYGHSIAETHRFIELDYRLVNRSQAMDYIPFTIESTVDENTGQVSNTLAQNRYHDGYSGDIQPAVDRMIMDNISLPPILELEWLREKIALDDQAMEILEQLGYMDILLFLSARHYRATQVEGYIGEDIEEKGIPSVIVECLENDGAIMEVEALEDTPIILSEKPLPHVSVPSIKSWKVIMAYGRNFLKLFSMCRKMSNEFKEIYWHMPILLSMFMCDLYGTGLNDWEKCERIDTETEIQDYLNSIRNLSITLTGQYTYCLSSKITRADKSFLESVLSVIYNKLHEKNMDLGTVSYREYQRINGPDISRAKVCLSCMGIEWDVEMKQADMKKEMQNEILSSEI